MKASDIKELSPEERETKLVACAQGLWCSERGKRRRPRQSRESSVMRLIWMAEF